MTRVLLIVLAAILACSTSGALLAQGALYREDDISPYLRLPGGDQPYPFSGNGVSVEQALRLFAKNLRIGLVMAGDVDGTLIQAQGTALTRKEFLEDLAIEFDLVWYFDGRVLQVSDLEDIETEILPLTNNSGTAIMTLLKELDIYQAKFTHRFDDRSRTFLVSGPKQYVELVKKAVEAIENSERTSVTLLRGKGEGLPEVIQSLEGDSTVVTGDSK